MTPVTNKHKTGEYVLTLKICPAYFAAEIVIVNNIICHNMDE